MRRVLFLPSWYPSVDNPVLGTFVQEHAKAAARHHDVVVLYVHEEKVGSEPATTTTALQERLVEVRSTFVLRRFRRLMPAAYLLAWTRGVRQFPRGWLPDVVHVHVGYPAGLGALLGRLRWRVPLVYTEQAGPLDEKILATRIARWVVPRLARVAALGAPVSRFLAQDMAEHGILPREFEVLPNTVDLLTFSRAEPPPAYDGGPLRLVAAALLVPGKGLENAIDCIAVLVSRGFDPHLRIAGSGPLRDHLEERAAAVGVAERVTFLGLIDKTGLGDEMRAAHAFVMASDRETFSAVVVEAMAAGLPVVATRSGGPEELVTSSTGVLVDRGSAEALADGICSITQNWGRYSGGPEAARQRFSIEAVGNRLADLYRKVTA